MRYRIELSTTRRGAARVHLPDRLLVLEAHRLAADAWEVSVAEANAAPAGRITLRAASANDAAWRVARAAVRAVAELTGQPLERGPGDIGPDAA